MSVCLPLYILSLLLSLSVCSLVRDITLPAVHLQLDVGLLSKVQGIKPL